MSKKTRLIIFMSCVACFFIVSPILIAYSLGYKFDIKTLRIVATGGIYIRTFPTADSIVVDSKAPEKPGLFSNSVFVQGLLPQLHTVSIEKDGYHSYQKTLPVKGNQVTKIEDVLLIKNNVAFNSIVENIDYFSVAKNNQNIITVRDTATVNLFTYFSINNPSSPTTFSIASFGTVSHIQWSEDSRFALIKLTNGASVAYYIIDTSVAKLTLIKLAYLDTNSREIAFNPQNSTQLFYVEDSVYRYDNILAPISPKVTTIVNDAIFYKISDGNIYALSDKGLLLQSDLTGQNTRILTLEPITLTSTKDYEILTADNKVFLRRDNDLFVLHQGANTFSNFKSPTTKYKLLLSPNGQNLVYYSTNNIYLYSFIDKTYTQIYSGQRIDQVYWLNNFYLIFNTGNQIIISEIDYRGNINTVTLPENIALGTKTITIESPQIFYNRQDNKLYILSEGSLISSEKLVP